MHPLRYTRAVSLAALSSLSLITAIPPARACDLDRALRKRASIAAIIPRVAVGIDAVALDTRGEQERDTSRSLLRSQLVDDAHAAWRIDLSWDIARAIDLMAGRCPTGGAP